MSAKNDLQEYFQKLHISLPTYTTSQASGKNHQPQWVSQVKIADGRIFMSTPQVSKKLAESEVAFIAHEAIVENGVDIKKPEPEYIFVFDNHDVAVFIDVENQSGALRDLIKKIYSKGITFYAFYSKGHPLGRKIKETNYASDERIKFKEVPSTRNDGADIGIIMTIGALLETNAFSTYIIVSNDHFAEAAADVIRGWHHYTPGSKHRFKSVACRNVDDVISELKILKQEEKINTYEDGSDGNNIKEINIDGKSVLFGVRSRVLFDIENDEAYAVLGKDNKTIEPLSVEEVQWLEDSYVSVRVKR